MTATLATQPTPSKPSRSRRRWVIVILLLCSYAGLMMFGGCADRLILHPPHGSISAGRATRLLIPNPQNRELEVWHATTPLVHSDRDVRAYVLEFCGNGTRAEQIAQYVADRWARYPVDAWVLNYPGYGGSAGKPRLADIPVSALEAYDELAKRAAGRPIFIAGNSLGTTAALYVAAHRPSAGMILQNPPPLRKLLLGQYGWWNLWLLAWPVSLQVPADLDSIANAANVHIPAVFLMAEHDEVVPPRFSRMVQDAYAGPKRVIPLTGATHGTSVKGDAAVQLQDGIDWLWSSGVH